MRSLLVPLAAVFTGDSQPAGGVGSSAAPSPWAQWEAFQVPPPKHTGRVLRAKVNMLFPRSVLLAIGRASVEQMRFLETLGKQAPRRSSRSWPQAHAGMGCCMGEALRQDPFQRVKGGEGCRCLVGNSSSSTCSGMYFTKPATGTTEDKPWQWHWIDDSISSLTQGSRERQTLSSAEWAKLLAHSFLPSPIQILPRCFSVKDRKAPFIVCHWVFYEYIKKMLSALSQFCPPCFRHTSYK